MCPPLETHHIFSSTLAGRKYATSRQYSPREEVAATVEWHWSSKSTASSLHNLHSSIQRCSKSGWSSRTSSKTKDVLRLQDCTHCVAQGRAEGQEIPGETPGWSGVLGWTASHQHFGTAWPINWIQLESLKLHSSSFSYQLKTCYRLSIFFRRLWAPTITRDSWGQWPDSEFGSRTPNTKLMVRRRPIFFRHIRGNYSTSSVHHARSLPSCSLRSIVLPENPCARSRFFEKMCCMCFCLIFFFPRKKLSA